ncbi:MAG: hypothetical protein Edafosvirus3_55 [Edafosvirus sp.]|uniref:Uncharacterized protein n=1 Tax=Edafosvirus sp. TaxID=2487765 RepID=A0A3G4ZSW8_9VIRU|nr:MAG: hypothetical protein Edafosvirus3_55 [Edafosvirus sp.]
MSKSNENRDVTEQKLMETSNGLLIKYYNKEGDKKEKIVIFGKGDKFSMKEMSGDKSKETELTRDQLIEELKKNKKLKFALEYVKAQKGGLKRGSRRNSRARKSSKKTSKRGSRKGSRKGSKRRSRRGSK